MRKQKLRCAHCGTTTYRKVLYGYPSPEALAQAERGEFVLGGCNVGEEVRVWFCDDCRRESDETRRRDTMKALAGNADDT